MSKRKRFMVEPDPASEEQIPSPNLPQTATLGQQFWPALLSVPLLTLLTGILFPLTLAALARFLFPSRADGSLIRGGGVIIGSELIGQNFSYAGYFHPRPSAAGDGYDATASGGANLGPSNEKLRQDVRQLANAYRDANGLSPDVAVPIDAVTRSGSGLDPHISPANADLQVARVARIRRLSEDTVRRLVAEHTDGPQCGFLGEARVSVLALNRALDHMAPLPDALAR
jgi:K+-transporting ATPase ATPase C chain